MSISVDPLFKVIAGFYVAKFVAKKADQYIDEKIDRARGASKKSSGQLTDMRLYCSSSADFGKWLLEELISTVQTGNTSKFNEMLDMYSPHATSSQKSAFWKASIAAGNELKRGSSVNSCENALALYDVCTKMFWEKDR